MNTWIYDLINNGVYKTGFATTQTAYETHVTALFTALDRVEAHLSSHQKRPGPYLFGESITDADVRLFPTIARFDVAYHTLFMCNRKMIRHDYPGIQRWYERLYWDEGEGTRGAFRKSTYFEACRKGYAHAAKRSIVPLGPSPEMLPLRK